MLARDVKWVDIVLESYVVRHKLISLLMQRAKTENIEEVQESDFEVQVWMAVFAACQSDCEHREGVNSLAVF